MNKARIQAFIEAVSSLRNIITDEQAIAVTAIYPDWKVEYSYTIGDRIIYKGNLYKVLQAHKSQVYWAPDVAASLYAKVLTTDNGTILPWTQPDSTNPYMKGDKVLHNGKTWESLIDTNTWEPGTIGTESLWVEVA